MDCKFEILLGSGSPRRRELLEMMDIPFRRISIKDVEETYPCSLAADEVSVYLSRLKADAYRSELHDNQLLITADTVVILDGEIIGKPVDRDDAVAILQRLSGKVHHVVTGVTLTAVSRMISFAEKTDVEFAKLSDEEISGYVDRYAPFDKAGAYGIQEWIGAVAVKRINGCFYNVMGLPTSSLYRQLESFCNKND